MPYARYELTPQDLELAQQYACFALTGIQIARVTRYDYELRHTDHVHPLTAQFMRKLYQACKQQEPFNGDELSILSHPALVCNTADHYEDAALELGILLELQEMGREVTLKHSYPVADDAVDCYRNTLES